MTSFLSAITVSALLNGLIWLVVVALIFWLVWWFINWVGIPEPFNKVIRVVLGLIAIILLINFLLSLTSSGGFIRF